MSKHQATDTAASRGRPPTSGRWRRATRAAAALALPLTAGGHRGAGLSGHHLHRDRHHPRRQQPKRGGPSFLYDSGGPVTPTGPILRTRPSHATRRPPSTELHR